ncbi:MAG: sulfur carrier protein ThiS [Candidatus Omnitrophota bacterium]
MNIRINGSERTFTGTKNLNEIILQFRKDNRRVIAELNGEIIKSPRWEEIVMKDGDTLELVTFVGGG